MILLTTRLKSSNCSIRTGTMYEITNNLYYGDIESASDTQQCREYGISHIIQLTYERPDSGYPDDAEIHTFSMMDGPRNNEAVFQNAVSKIVELLDRRATVLVHCSAGRSRSTCVSAAALARSDSISFEQAIGHVRSAGPVNAHEALLLHGKNAVDQPST
ncbi:dual specificity protein phosphatase family protein [Natrialbaceae archaeon A-CW1-1]